MSHAQFGRIERAELRQLTVDQVARAASAVGLRVTARCYPDGDPIRDAAQLALLERLRVRLPRGVRFRTEVALPLPGDQRAWDAVAVFADGRAAIEAETRIRDIQALERRIALKGRDGGIDLLVLLVAGTDANRRALATHRELLRDAFPLDSRVILAALESGHVPPANGIVIL